MSSIFFLIYINKVFNKVSKTSLLITLLFFVNNLGFIALSSLVKKIVKALKKIAKKILTWEMLNAITYNISKTKAVFFSRSYCQ